MADLIERDAVAYKVKSCITIPADSEWDSGYNTAMAEAKQYIQNATAVNRWIPVEDALPDALQNVLVCTDINTVTVAWLNGDHWTFADTGCGHTENWTFDTVKFWMPLPEPPER